MSNAFVRSIKIPQENIPLALFFLILFTMSVIERCVECFSLSRIVTHKKDHLTFVHAFFKNALENKEGDIGR